MLVLHDSYMQYFLYRLACSCTGWSSQYYFQQNHTPFSEPRRYSLVLYIFAVFGCGFQCLSRDFCHCQLLSIVVLSTVLLLFPRLIWNNWVFSSTTMHVPWCGRFQWGVVSFPLRRIYTLKRHLDSFGTAGGGGGGCGATTPSTTTMQLGWSRLPKLLQGLAEVAFASLSARSFP